MGENKTFLSGFASLNCLLSYTLDILIITSGTFGSLAFCLC
jgi:hypothetical protein